MDNPKSQRCPKKKRDKAYTTAVKSRSPDDWNHFKRLRQASANIIKASHNVYINSEVGATIQENPKNIWSYIKNLRKDHTTILTIRTPTHHPSQ